jgi:non-ribosomal peptide synthetase component F
MAELYAAAASDRPAALAPARSFRNYLAWLEGWDRGAAERHWRETLRGFDRPLSLGGPAREGSVGSGAHHGIVPADLAAALEETARRHRLTLATVIQGAWALLLGHWGRAEDVVIGNIVSGRPADLEGSRTMVGTFVGAVPLRVTVEPEAVLVDWLAALQRREQASKEHGHLSLADIQRHADVPPGTPLFEHTFVLNNYPTEVDGSGVGEDPGAGAVHFAEIREEETIPYALDLMIARRADLRLRILYDPRRFDATKIETVAVALVALLRSMVERPAAAVGEHLEVLARSGLRDAPARTFSRVRPREIGVGEGSGGRR